MIPYKQRFWVLLFSSLILGFSIFSHLACAPGEIVNETLDPVFSGRNILVLPIKDMSKLYGQNKSVISPLSGKYFITGMVMDNSDLLLTDELVNFVEKRPDYICFPPSQAQGQMEGLMAEKSGGTWNRQFLAKVGRGCKADAVLTGCVYRFQQRVGNEHSVESPASVEFEIHLISSLDGAIIWSGVYNETQQSLSENLLNIKIFMKRKGRWITAEQMAVSGLLDVLRTFPDYANNTGN